MQKITRDLGGIGMMKKGSTIKRAINRGRRQNLAIPKVRLDIITIRFLEY